MLASRRLAHCKGWGSSTQVAKATHPRTLHLVPSLCLKQRMKVLACTPVQQKKTQLARGSRRQDPEKYERHSHAHPPRRPACMHDNTHELLPGPGVTLDWTILCINWCEDYFCCFSSARTGNPVHDDDTVQLSNLVSLVCNVRAPPSSVTPVFILCRQPPL